MARLGLGLAGRGLFTVKVSKEVMAKRGVTAHPVRMHLRLSKEDADRLKLLAAHWDIPQAEVIRVLINQPIQRTHAAVGE